jgi:hypothetical protein
MVNPAAGRLTAGQLPLHWPRSLAGIPRCWSSGLCAAVALLSSSSPRPEDRRRRPELEKTSLSWRFANGARVKVGRRGRGASALLLPCSRRGRHEPEIDGGGRRSGRRCSGGVWARWSSLGGSKYPHGSRNVDSAVQKSLLRRQLLTGVVAAVGVLRRWPRFGLRKVGVARRQGELTGMEEGRGQGKLAVGPAAERPGRRPRPGGGAG